MKVYVYGLVDTTQIGSKHWIYVIKSTALIDSKDATHVAYYTRAAVPTLAGLNKATITERNRNNWARLMSCVMNGSATIVSTEPA